MLRAKSPMYRYENVPPPAEESLQENLLAPSPSLDGVEVYSEWKIKLAYIPSRTVVAQSVGFDPRDFRTRDGKMVIDLEVYQKLQTDAEAILSKHAAIYLGLTAAAYLCLTLPMDLLSPDNSTKYWRFCSVVLVICIFGCLKEHLIIHRTEEEIAAMIASKESHFREAYGIELGLKKSVKSWLPYWGSNESYIYLCRTHNANDDMVIDQEAAPAERSIPPIFLARCVPGDFSIVDETYDTSLGIDTDTWALLQSKHQEHQDAVGLRDRVVFRIVTIAHRLLMAFLVASILIWAWNDRGDLLLWVVLACCACILTVPGVFCFLIMHSKTEQLVVVDRVNEALPENGDLALELHTSPLSGRGTYSYVRYQFVYNAASSQQEVV